MKPTTPTPNKGGRPAHPAITELSKQLAVTRRRAAQILKEGGSSDEIRQLRAQKLRLEISKLEVELAARKGELVLRTDMAQTGIRLGNILAQSRARLAATLPARLAGLSEMDVCVRLRAAFDAETDSINKAVERI